MIKNDVPTTSVKQRLVIIVIAIFLLASTFALYAGMVISAKSSSDTQARQMKFRELYAQYQQEIDDQAKTESKKYFDEFKTYKTRVKSFNAADVKELKKEDLKVGTGAEVNNMEFKNYSAYYIGWLADEKVFDSSFDNYDKPSYLRSPVAGTSNLIQGWKEGVQGMKIGGVREITIPAVIGYGSQKQGEIPPNSPLKFVIMLVDPVKLPTPSEELRKKYQELTGEKMEI